ncbi:unnamed protein product [Vicia faba]|uniref:DUF4283 domain-containing protein n=1 Tax=Vicia faba TaxID=3906 RepID=A0AAV0YC89_VICFA|nr:unnamed protein product [Vicia faba]
MVQHIRVKLSALWSSFAKWGITFIGKGFYKFSFSNLEDVRRVRFMPSWNFNPCLLKLFPWTRDFIPRNVKNTSAQELRDKILVERVGFAFFVDIEYEKLPDLCNYCRIIGHSEAYCRRATNRDEKENNKKNDLNNGPIFKHKEIEKEVAEKKKVQQDLDIPVLDMNGNNGDNLNDIAGKHVDVISSTDSEFVDAIHIYASTEPPAVNTNKNAKFIKLSWDNMADNKDKRFTSEEDISNADADSSRPNLHSNLWCIYKLSLDPNILSITDQFVAFSFIMDSHLIGVVAVYASTSHLDRRRENFIFGPTDELRNQERQAQLELEQEQQKEDFFWAEKANLDWHLLVTGIHPISIDPTQDGTIVDEVISNLVDTNMNNILFMIPNLEEVTNVIHNLNKSSAPGSDGFRGVFYHTYWDIIQQDVYKATIQFFKTGWILPHYKSCTVMLIPKSKDAQTMNNYRPITLSNFKYKIISKIIADRISSILPFFDF